MKLLVNLIVGIGDVFGCLRVDVVKDRDNKQDGEGSSQNHEEAEEKSIEVFGKKPIHSYLRDIVTEARILIVRPAASLITNRGV